MMDEILKSLRIRGKCVAVKEHRHFRLYDIKLEQGQSIKRLESCAREIGLYLCSLSTPIISTILGEGLVRIQVTISEPEVLDFISLYDKSKYNRPEGLLQVLLGEDSVGNPVWLDLSKCPHALISGASGSGKSTLLQTIIANLMFREDVLLYLVDPKNGCEFGQHEKIATVVFDYDGTIRLLERLHKEMETRYIYFRRLGIKNLTESQFVVPKIIVIIDEVSDLLLQDKDKKNSRRGDLERLLISLAQKSRAVGIHLILSTQRPSVDIITGLIKANFPSRIACKVSSSVDSKVILDQSGAENLMGRGDALIVADKYNCSRFQVALS